MRNFFTKGLTAAVLALLLVANPVLAAGTNGTFEAGTEPGSFSTLTAVNNTDITDWSVDSGSVDYIGTYWTGSNGQRSVDLNGLAPASISQTFGTTNGATYNVTFDLSGNPDSLPEGDPLFSPSDKIVSVTATGGAPAAYSFDTVAMGNSLGNMMWQPKSYSFVASGASATLTFASQISGAFGPVIDNVVITEQVPQCNAQASGSVVSDTSTTNTTDALPAVLAWTHLAWDAVISGASWIWATNPTVTISETDVTKVFSKSFSIVGTPTTGTLQIAADNNYTVKVNGNVVPVVFDQNNFQSGTQDSYDVSAFLVSGSNTLEVTVTNWGVGQSTNPEENPAGLLYKLSYTNNECVTPPPATTGTITVTKVVSGGSLLAGDFPLFVGETQVVSGVSNAYTAGTYTVHETGNADYTPSFSGDCVATQASLDRLNLIADWQAKKLALQMAILNNPGDAGNAAKEALIVDANNKIVALQNSLEAVVDLSVGENAQCTITNTFVPPPSVTSCPADTHPVLVETVAVNSSSLAQTMSAASLTSGAPYLLVASGTWINLPYNEADAEFTSTDAWVTHADGYNISPYFLGEGEFDLQVNGGFVNWGTYNTAHIYTIPFTGLGATVGFMMFDGDSTQPTPTPEAGWYGDNSGSLSVDIIKCVSNFGSLKIIKNTIGGDGTFAFAGVGEGASITTVGGSGNATIANLAPGTYSATEAAQAGWNLTSNTCTNVEVVAGEIATCTVTNTAQSSISGQKYNDLNRNGKKDVGEPGLAGWTIRLKNAQGQVVATAITDANGNYTFPNLADGTYKVREKNQKGWKRMSKNPKAIVITAGSVVVDVDFGNAKKKSHEHEDTQADCDRDDQHGEYHGNGWKSNYQKDQDNDKHKSKKSNSKSKSKNNRG